MTLTDFATHLTARIRAEGANSYAVTVGLHLAAIAWTCARPADIDSDIRTGLAAITALTVFDHLDRHPQPTAIDSDFGAPEHAAAIALAALLTAIADTFADAAEQNTKSWYTPAVLELRSAVAVLT